MSHSLSVLLANYNHARYLETRIPSILDELPSDGELLFIDDASQDQSLAIARKFSSDGRLKIYWNTKNLGAHASVNFLLSKSQGIYICSLGADDLILPGFFQKSLEALKKAPHIPLCCSDNGYIEEHRDSQKILSDKSLKGKDSITFLSAQDVHDFIYTNQFYIPGHTVILKKEFLLNYGGYQHKLENIADWYVNYAVALSSGIIYLPETLSVWRIHPGSYSSICASNQKRLKNIYIQLLMELRKTSLRKPFRNSVVLESFLRKFFWSLLLFHPSEMDFLFHYAFKKWKRKMELVKAYFSEALKNS